MTTPDVVVVGGGISGLVAAFDLVRRGVSVTVMEADTQVGGKLRSHQIAGLTLDAGAESVLARRPEFVDLVADLELSGQLVSPAASGVDVVIGRERRRLPRHQVLGIPYKFEELAASGILDEAGTARARQDLQLPAQAFDDDISVGELVGQRMGEQVVERLVEPLLAGVYASSAGDLSVDVVTPGLRAAVNAHGSLAAAAETIVLTQSRGQSGFRGVTGGMGTVVTHLHQRIDGSPRGEVRVSTRVSALSQIGDRWRVHFDHSEGDGFVDAGAVVIATPAWAAHRLLTEVSSKSAQLLGSIDHASVVLVTLLIAADRAPKLPEGTGLLVPPREDLLMKAVTYLSQKWDWVKSAAGGSTVIRLSMGRAGDNRAWRMSDAEVVARGTEELAGILRQPIEPSDSSVTRWERAIPVYRVGHPSTVERINAAANMSPGLVLCGAALAGVGIPACIASGRQASTRVVQFLGLG